MLNPHLWPVLGLQDSFSLTFGDLPAWVMVLVAVLGIGYNVSLVLPRLQMLVLDVGVQRVEGGTALILAHICFVNPSSLHKTVCQIKTKAVRGASNARMASRVFDRTLASVSYSIPFGEYQVSLPVSESLQTPVHLSPHESVSKWLSILVDVEPQGTQSFSLSFDAYDHRAKDGRGKLASLPEVIFIPKPIVV
jgi:hypothetical protein